MLSAILVALIATCSTWWLSHVITRTWLYPLWSGFLVAIAMGEPMRGMEAAAYIQLTYLGWITAGGTMPGNLMVAGIFGTALTLLSGADPILAPTFAVPFSLLGILTWQAYMTLNSIWVHKADKYVEEGNLIGIRAMNWIPSGILSFILNGIPALRRGICNAGARCNPAVSHRCVLHGRCTDACAWHCNAPHVHRQEENSCVLLCGIFPHGLPAPRHDGDYGLCDNRRCPRLFLHRQ